jgi:hypothetical protein
VAGLREWICSGACQSETGAFVAWIDAASGEPAYDYPEITGYALTYIASQPELSERELEVGQRAAEWLTGRLRAQQLAARDGWDGDAVYLFDLGMIASGLISFGRRVQVDRFSDAGLALVDVLASELQAGELVSAISARGAGSQRTGWSTGGLVHLAKLTQAFLLADRGALLAEFVTAVSASQHADGRMPTDGDDPVTMLHPHLYAAEGLWMWGSARGDDEALARARAAVEWAWAQQLETGGFPRSVTDGASSDAPIEQCDVTAQAVRLALLLGIRSPAVSAAVARLVALAHGADGRLAMIYQPSSAELHANTWATLFAAQALALALAEPGASLSRWQDLV